MLLKELTEFLGIFCLVDPGDNIIMAQQTSQGRFPWIIKIKKLKEIFTRVLQGHLNLSNFKIKKNTSGSELDQVARKNLKSIKLDYAHGTGHGVGYFLNVHEGPQSISKLNKVKLKPGMILSNEPGYYKKGKFGIRIENLIYVKKNQNRMKFDNLTFCSN